MKVSRIDIINKLKEKGLLLNISVEDELLTTYDFFLETLVNEETGLLEEILRIQEKIDANLELTYLEDIFYKYVVAKYKK